jgi:carbamoyl-phosphate synthase/aspartate carbamoyltransferase
MLSVGEVMAIGRSFEEVIQKACRMVNPSLDGLDGIDSNLVDESVPLEDLLKTPTDSRLFAIQAALEQGWTIDRVYDLTKIDKWFLNKLQNIALMRRACLKAGSIEMFDANGSERMRMLKTTGFSDRQVS